MTWLRELTGPTLLLRPLCREDERLYTRLYGDPDVMAQIMPALEPGRASRAFAIEFDQSTAMRPARFTWTLADRPDGAAFGLLGLVLDTRQGAEVGVVLPPDRQGRGHATEAIALAADHAFEILGLQRLTTRHAGEHGPAAGLMRRLGFEAAPDGAPPHPVRWILRRDAWTLARRDKSHSFS